MPEHVHLLIDESARLKPQKVIQVFKQRVSRRMRGKKRAAGGQLELRFPDKDVVGLRRFWQRRYFDLNIYATSKILEKLHYMHANPVRAKLVQNPGDWPWSSWCYYYGRKALLEMDAW
jgi:putative transposase